MSGHLRAFGCSSDWHDLWTRAGTACPKCGSGYMTPARVKIAEAKRKRREAGYRRG